MRTPRIWTLAIACFALGCSSSESPPSPSAAGTSSGGALATSGAAGAATAAGRGGTSGTGTAGGGATSGGNGGVSATTSGASGTSSNVGANGGAGDGGTSGANGGRAQAGRGGRASMTGGDGGNGMSAAGGLSATGGAGANAGTSSGGRGNGGASGDAGSGASGSAGAPAGWTLSWSDEFDGPSGEAPDPSKWAYDVGGDGWGNNELEYYTNRTDNSQTDGSGNLAITLKSETYMNRSYTSARLLTQGKFTQAYGRFEARIKVPRGQGVWPAFWMLGDDIKTNVWPNCGEIDIMENAGREPTINHGSLHGPGYSGGSPLTGTYTLKSGALADDFHVYYVEWETNTVRFYVDGDNYETRKSTDVPSGAKWVYDHPFFMILNVAIGGAFGGAPDGTTMLPQTMLVDYVRVYTKS